MSSVTPTQLSDRRRLGRFFNRNSYCRRPDEDEVGLVNMLIRRVGLNPGKSFAKGKKWIVPIYGREAVESFQQWSELVEKQG
jgi:hypothetical protein